MSLRDRLRRRQTPGEGTPVDEALTTSAEREALLDTATPPDGTALDELLGFTTPATPTATPTPPRGMARPTGFHAAPAEPDALSPIEQLKIDLHRRLIDRLDLKALEEIKDQAVLTAQIRDAVTEFLRTENTPLSQHERDEIVEEVVYEITGLGPLEPFFRDPTISDILVNGPRDIYVERHGRLARVPAAFRDNAHLLAVIDRIVSRVGRRVDESSPMVDARLPDGSRVNAIIPPLALDGAVLSIRRFGSQIGIEELIAHGTMTKTMAMLLAACVHARLNILISGGTGSGKTTLLNALSSFIPHTERVVTIEDAAELRLQQEHVVRLETRPPNVEGRGEVTARDLVRNALRMRPDRIIIGEVRSSEAIDMLQAMNTGHEGSMATIHANTPRDALSRLETMILTGGTSLPIRALRDQIASTLDVVVQVARLSDGSRRVVSITEVTGVEGDVITTNEIFVLRRQGLADGRVVGRFMPTGIRPVFAERLAVAGVHLPPAMFDDMSGEAVGLDVDGVTIETSSPAASHPWGEIAHGLETLDERALRAAQQVQQMEAAARAAREEVDEQRRAAIQARVRSEELERELARLRLELERARASSSATAPADDEGRRRAALVLLAFVESLDEVAARARASADPRDRERAADLERRTARLLEALGFEEIEALGQRADEAAHEVVRTVPRSNGTPPGQIVEVVQRGFRLDGQVARRAQVVIVE